MIEHRPETKTMKISEVRSQLNSLVNGVFRKKTRVLVEKSGIPVAAIVSTTDLERLDRLDQERETDFAVIDELRESFKDVPDEEIERETDRILAKVRAEIQAERQRSGVGSR